VTKNIPRGQYVVDKIDVKVKGNAPGINSSKLKRYVQQPSLRKLFGMPIYAYIYNIPDPKKDKIREKKKEKKLRKKNEKIVHRYDLRTARIQAKRNRYYYFYNEWKEKDSLKAQRYYSKYQNFDSKLKERKSKRPEELSKLMKNDIFLFSDFLRENGQAPPIYNPYLVDKSATYMKNFLKAYGYYKAQVQVEKKIKNKKVFIDYIIYPGPQLKIDKVEYNIQDSAIAKLIRENIALQLFPDLPLQISLLQNYRNTLVNYLKEHGYYYFVKDYITFTIDTLGRDYKAKVIVNISMMKDQNGNFVPHPKMFIRNVYVFTDYNPNEALRNPQEFFSDCDTNVYFSRDSLPYYFIKKYKYVIRPKVLLKEIYVQPKTLYRFSIIKNTYSHLTKFAVFKIVNIDLKPVENSKNYLDCNIQLTPAKNQSLSGEIVGTNSSATIGAATNITYEHKNLFRGGEIFSIQLHSALESQKFYLGGFRLDSMFVFNTEEFSVDVRLTIPRLLLPFSLGGFVEKSNPRTVFQLYYSFLNRPEYNRIDLTENFSYYWKANDYTNHILTPLKISSVRVWDMLPEFRELLVFSLLEESYQDYFIFGTDYSFTFSNQGENVINNFFFQTNISSSGNSMYALMNLFNGSKNEDGVYYMPGFKTVFAQFVKWNGDFRVYHNFINGNQIVWRFFGGVVVPFVNSKLVPFGEKYFIGGSNSIRAWSVRTLGPGSFRLPENVRFPNQTGDIKLETNLEYRFSLVWKLEGAIFMDVGNIWAINQYDTREGSVFYFNKFYEQLAVGTGFGLRLNLNFFVLRTDLGIKLYDPCAEIGYRFIPSSRPYNRNDFVINIAIGYPF